MNKDLVWWLESPQDFLEFVCPVLVSSAARDVGSGPVLEQRDGEPQTQVVGSKVPVEFKTDLPCCRGLICHWVSSPNPPQAETCLSNMGGSDESRMWTGEETCWIRLKLTSGQSLTLLSLCHGYNPIFVLCSTINYCKTGPTWWRHSSLIMNSLVRTHWEKQSYLQHLFGYLFPVSAVNSNDFNE